MTTSPFNWRATPSTTAKSLRKHEAGGAGWKQQPFTVARQAKAVEPRRFHQYQLAKPKE